MDLVKIQPTDSGEQAADIIYNNDQAVVDYIPTGVGETLALTPGFVVVPTPNLMVGATYAIGKYLNISGGEMPYSDNTVAYTTNYIPVTPLTAYRSTFTGFNSTLIFYDKFFAFLGGLTGVDAQPVGVFTTPVDCAFIRTNFLVAQLATEKIALNSGIDLNIPPSKIESAVVFSKNLTEGMTIQLGQYIGPTGDVQNYGDNTVGYSTNYIPVVENTGYESSYTALGNHIAFYDSALAWIDTIGSSEIGVPFGRFTSPTGAAFMRVNFYAVDIGEKSVNLDYGEGAVYIEKLYVLESHIIKSTPGGQTFSPAMRNVTTFVGAMNTIIEKLLLANPRARFCFISHFTEDWQGKNDTTPLIQVQKILADYWQAPILDMSQHMQLVYRDGVDNLGQVVPDRLHPGTDSGGQTVERYAVACAAFLRGFFDDWATRRIAWFGTSIPYGHPNPALYAYPPKVGVKLGAAGVFNYAVSGSTARTFHADGSAMPGRNGIRFSDLTSTVNYQNSILDKIGGADEPDLYVFDFGVNDYAEDRTDFLGLL